MICDHTITQGREGKEGSWCVKCGFKRLEVHSVPCKECKYFWSNGFGYKGCGYHLMRVISDMRVTYTLQEDGSNDLCFVQRKSN